MQIFVSMNTYQARRHNVYHYVWSMQILCNKYFNVCNNNDFITARRYA